MSFSLYTEFLPELQGVVRQQCMPSDRCMLTMTCKREYDAATVEDRTRYWRRVTTEGDPEGKMRAWIEKQPEDVPLVKLVTLAVDALAAKQLTVYQWLADYYMDTCPSRRNRMTFDEAAKVFHRMLQRAWHAEDTTEVANEAYNVYNERYLTGWDVHVQKEIGYRGDRETWQVFAAIPFYGPFGLARRGLVSIPLMIGLCKAGHSAWIQEVLDAGFMDLEYCIVITDNVDMLRAWHTTHGPGWELYHLRRMVRSGAMKCLRYYLSHGGTLQHDCVSWALTGTAETCATVVPFLLEQGATWDMATLESQGISVACRPWLEYLRQRQTQ
jgi:hypothetical protein